jgi:hypothetical protein
MSTLSSDAVGTSGPQAAPSLAWRQRHANSHYVYVGTWTRDGGVCRSEPASRGTCRSDSNDECYVLRPELRQREHERQLERSRRLGLREPWIRAGRHDDKVAPGGASRRRGTVRSWRRGIPPPLRLSHIRFSLHASSREWPALPRLRSRRTHSLLATRPPSVRSLGCASESRRPLAGRSTACPRGTCGPSCSVAERKASKRIEVERPLPVPKRPFDGILRDPLELPPRGSRARKSLGRAETRASCRAGSVHPRGRPKR